MKSQSKKLLLKSVGDIAPGDFTINGIGVLSMTKKYGCEYPFEKIKDSLGNPDLLFGNLEDSLSDECLKRDLRHCGLPGIAKALRKVGFDVLGVANNHAFDHGADILLETVRHCLNAGIQICGLRGPSVYHSQPVILEKGSLRIGILAYNWIGLENESGSDAYIANIQDGVVNYTWHRDVENDRTKKNGIVNRNINVLNDIRLLKDEANFIILMPHWGYEWTIYPPYGVVLEARKFIDAGANLIIGSHPHVFQGVEEYNGGLIAYSLGNFLFDTISHTAKYGIILSCVISPGSIHEYNIQFIKRGESFQPEPVSDEEERECLYLFNQSNMAITSDRVEKVLDDEIVYEKFVQCYHLLKFKKIVFLAVRLLRQPELIKPIIRKISSFINIISRRIIGQKVRW